MVSKLFILVKPPSEYHSLNQIKKIAGDDKRAALLFEDAVYFAADRRKSGELLDAAGEVFVIADDLEARGFGEAVPEGYTTIDYPRAVDLVVEEF
ncbi:MAG: sulfurtransferase complex subunit TusB, partial [Euryarchaeota archaeon]|nr:sulfurtransferase complex subunit TusB [Euryarchaeota archaeon]